MPTWYAYPPRRKSTRSPGRAARRDTPTPRRFCRSALCGNDTRTVRKTYLVYPEQSNVRGPAAPKTYGRPRRDLATAMTLARVFETGLGTTLIRICLDTDLASWWLPA